MRTIYFTKTYLSGLKKGMSINCQIAASDVSFWRKGRKGKDCITGSKWIITDASFQKYDRS